MSVSDCTRFSKRPKKTLVSGKQVTKKSSPRQLQIFNQFNCIFFKKLRLKNYSNSHFLSEKQSTLLFIVPKEKNTI